LKIETVSLTFNKFFKNQSSLESALVFVLIRCGETQVLQTRAGPCGPCHPRAGLRPRLAGLDFFERLERMTMTCARGPRSIFPLPPDKSRLCLHRGIQHCRRGKRLGRFHFGLYWPRERYGRLIAELSEQGRDRLWPSTCCLNGCARPSAGADGRRRPRRK